MLVLDDALSAVNPSLEEEIFARIRAHAPQTAVLLITRRRLPHGIADRVVQLPPPAEQAVVEAVEEIAEHAPTAREVVDERTRSLVHSVAPTSNRSTSPRNAAGTRPAATADEPVGGWEVVPVQVAHAAASRSCR